MSTTAAQDQAHVATPVPKSPAIDIEAAAARLHAYLVGYGRNNIADLHALTRYPGWQRAAFDEQQRRARRLIEMLDGDLLEAIANGDVKVEHVAKAVAEQLQAKR